MRVAVCAGACCCVLQCVVLCGSVGQCAAVCGSVRQCAAEFDARCGCQRQPEYCSRPAVAAMHRSLRSGCVDVSRHAQLLVQCRSTAALRRCAGIAMRVMRGCVSTLCLGCKALLCRCYACVFPRGIRSLFVVALLLCRARVCTCMASLSSRYNLRDHCCVAGLPSTVGWHRQVSVGCSHAALC